MRISDWSSDVCSSDLLSPPRPPAHLDRATRRHELAAGAGAVSHPCCGWDERGAVRAGFRCRRFGCRHCAVGRLRGADGRGGVPAWMVRERAARSEEHTSELQSLMRISYAVFCLKKKTT